MSPLDHNRPRGKAYWRSLDDLADTPEFREFVFREFPAGATEMLDSGERRQFLKIMGASLALAGFGLAGCRRWPKEQIAPFANRPEGRVPGAPEYYATSMELGGVADGLLVTSFDGRPVKIEGNPEHPVSRGGSGVEAQASVLELYDPDRSRYPMLRETDSRHQSSWHAFETWATKHFDSLGNAKGGGLAVLSEATESPSVGDMRARVMKRFPRAAWYEYEPINTDHEMAGSNAAFGATYRPQYSFNRAKVVVSLDSDFLLASRAMVRNTRDFAQGRKRLLDGTSTRLYVFESAFSLTGANADNRFAVRSRDVSAIAALLAARLVPDAAASASAREQSDRATPEVLGLDAAVLDQVVSDLKQSRGDSIVLAGPRQPAEVHVLAALINEHLGSVGRTVRYTPLPDATQSVPSITSLTKDLDSGRIHTLVILGGNPAYDAPADLDFAGKLSSQRLKSVHLSIYDNETSRLCTWHLPRAHYLESWADGRAWDGTWSIAQPLIEPLFGGRSPLELLAVMEGGDVRAGYDIVRRTMSESAKRTDFEQAWRRTLHDGFLAGSAATLMRPDVRRPACIAAVESIWQQWAPAPAGEMELVFVPDTKVYDGRFANNGWLQELPDPMTKLTWDNAVLAGVEAAGRLGVTTGDRVRVTHGDRQVEAAVCVMPGQCSNSVTLSLGYGRPHGGTIAEGAGFDFYALRTADAMGFTTGAVEKISGHYPLAQTQDHHAIDSTAGKGTQARLPSLFREATLQQFKDNPRFANDHHHTGAHAVHRLSLWNETNLEGAVYAWAMSIDLNACTGCSACVVACQAENNIPIVGKDQVLRGREMHWLRIDRYFQGHDPETPRSVGMQPIPCMMCENAPCEQVCPVAATTHDKDGLNVMVYNRCVGTRYCSNNCPYKVRRFNYFDYWKRGPEREMGLLHVKPDYYTKPQTDMHPLRRMQMNPEVTVRSRGVMEKCTYCIQRISVAKIEAKNAWVKMTPEQKQRQPRATVPDGSLTTACAQACPAQAIIFGDMNDPTSRVSDAFKGARSYQMLEEINTKPRTRYLAKLRDPAPVGAQEAGSAGHEEPNHG